MKVAGEIWLAGVDRGWALLKASLEVTAVSVVVLWVGETVGIDVASVSVIGRGSVGVEIGVTHPGVLAPVTGFFAPVMIVVIQNESSAWSGSGFGCAFAWPHYGFSV